MPHIHLEYSANCKPTSSFDTLFREIHETIVGIGGIRLDNLKSRASQKEDFYIADGSPRHAFAHLSIRFVEGRSPTVKDRIGSACLDHLKTFFSEQLVQFDLQLTVEVRDIRLANYHKHPEGTLTNQRSLGDWSD